jgi:hypothetical protein
MPSEDDAPPEATPAAVPPPPPPPPPTPVGTEAPSARRRRQRSWSAPSPTAPTPEFERPLTERDWARDRPTVTAERTSTPPPPPPPGPKSSSGLPAAAPTRPPIGADVVAAVAELKADVTGLRDELQARDAARDGTLVTGDELAASIDALGTTLGTGLAALLTEHRSLLARDLDAATDRILEEVNQRLRASSTQTVESVEDRSRHVTAKAVGDLSSALELRLDQLEADLSGLRAVLLEIPDQTQLVERLDQLSDAVGSGRGSDSPRVSPALSAALDAQTERLDALAKEVTSLRRRIALRPDLLTDAPAAAHEDEVPPPPPAPSPAARARRTPTKATKAAKAAPAKAPARKAAKRPAR